MPSHQNEALGQNMADILLIGLVIRNSVAYSQNEKTAVEALQNCGTMRKLGQASQND